MSTHDFEPCGVCQTLYATENLTEFDEMLVCRSVWQRTLYSAPDAVNGSGRRQMPVTSIPICVSAAMTATTPAAIIATV